MVASTRCKDPGHERRTSLSLEFKAASADRAARGKAGHDHRQDASLDSGRRRSPSADAGFPQPRSRDEYLELRGEQADPPSAADDPPQELAMAAGGIERAEFASASSASSARMLPVCATETGSRSRAACSSYGAPVWRGTDRHRGPHCSYDGEGGIGYCNITKAAPRSADTSDTDNAIITLKERVAEVLDPIPMVGRS